MLDYLNTRLNKQSHVGEHQVRNLIGATPGSHILLLLFVFFLTKPQDKAIHGCKSKMQKHLIVVSQHTWNYLNFKFTP